MAGGPGTGGDALKVGAEGANASVTSCGSLTMASLVLLALMPRPPTTMAMRGRPALSAGSAGIGRAYTSAGRAPSAPMRGTSPGRVFSTRRGSGAAASRRFRLATATSPALPRARHHIHRGGAGHRRLGGWSGAGRGLRPARTAARFAGRRAAAVGAVTVASSILPAISTRRGRLAAERVVDQHHPLPRAPSTSRPAPASPPTAGTAPSVASPLRRRAGAGRASSVSRRAEGCGRSSTDGRAPPWFRDACRRSRATPPKSSTRRGFRRTGTRVFRHGPELYQPNHPANPDHYGRKVKPLVGKHHALTQPQSCPPRPGPGSSRKRPAQGRAHSVSGRRRLSRHAGLGVRRERGVGAPAVEEVDRHPGSRLSSWPRAGHRAGEPVFSSPCRSRGGRGARTRRAAGDAGCRNRLGLPGRPGCPGSARCRARCPWPGSSGRTGRSSARWSGGWRRSGRAGDGLHDPSPNEREPSTVARSWSCSAPATISDAEAEPPSSAR